MKNKDVPFFIIFLVLSFILRFPSFSFPLDYDVGGHVFWGEQVVRSGFYTVLQELRPVGVLTIFAIFFKFFGLNLIWVPLLGVSFWALSAFVLYRLAKILFDSERISFLSALIFSLITASRAVQGELVNMETFFITFSLLGLFSYFQFEKEGKKRSIFFCGLFFGVSFLTKHLAVFDLFPVILLTFLPVLRKLKWDRNFLLLAGFIFPLFLVSFYFLAVGKLSDFYYWQFAKIYSNVSPFRELGNPLENLWLSFSSIFKKTTLFWLLVAGGILTTLWSKRTRQRCFLLVWFFSVSTGIYLLWWFFPHHYLQLLPSLSIFAALFLVEVFDFHSRVLSPIKIRNDVLPAREGPGYLRLRNKNRLFAGVLILGLVQYLGADPGYYFGSLERIFNQINYEEYLEKAGFDVGPDGWLPLYRAGRYLRETSNSAGSLFAWTSIPFIYTLSGKTPVSWYVYKAPLQSKDILPRNFRGWFPDVEDSREELMEVLFRELPEYILIGAEPENIFDEMVSFSEFSNFVVNNYVFDRMFGHILIYQKVKGEAELGGGKVIPLEIVERFAAITDVEESGEQTTVAFEPMVNPNGVLRSFRVVYPEPVKLDFEPLSVEFLGTNGRDFVGHAVFKPSGVVDLHIKVEGLAKPVSFVRVKTGNITWNNRSYGVNRPLKVVQKGEIFDLYFEPPSDWKEKEFEVYLIYEDGSLARPRGE